MTHQDHFCITLFSAASQKVYKDNTHSSFKCELAVPIDLVSTDTWEVGVSEIIHPIPKSENASNLMPKYALIFCDLISPQYVGTALVR